ncbi:MAG: hypothetical protein WCI56_11005 [Hyphomicrobiales bacterium]
MRVLLVPLVAVGALFGSANDEPTEQMMRSAFESSLAAKVRSAVTFVSETGGAEALATVRKNGTDRFNINDFHKRECKRSGEMPGYVCNFTVRIDLVNGALQGTMSGRFIAAPGGLVYAPEA